MGDTRLQSTVISNSVGLRTSSFYVEDRNVKLVCHGSVPLLACVGQSPFCLGSFKNGDLRPDCYQEDLQAWLSWSLLQLSQTQSQKYTSVCCWWKRQHISCRSVRGWGSGLLSGVVPATEQINWHAGKSKVLQLFVCISSQRLVTLRRVWAENSGCTESWQRYQNHNQLSRHFADGLMGLIYGIG